MNQNTKAVRQIIHNEIGITKEEIRAEFKKIMKEQLQKAINIMVSEKLVESAVSYNVGRFMVGHKYSSDVILTEVKNEVRKQVAEKIMKSLDISVEAISAPEGE